ncbi:hypothetical protein K4V09_11700 [Staphylococcus epidermidis]|nr:hypothetical protein [Staphylococcus epidermidis]
MFRTLKKINCNNEFEVLKDTYINGRVVLYLYNKDDLINLTVNIPEVILMSDVIGDEVYSSILNHIDGYNYEELIDVLVDSNIITSFQNGEVNSGFNHYKGIIINEEKLFEMRNIKEVIYLRLLLFWLKDYWI